jgi:hypothetical protein
MSDEGTGRWPRSTCSTAARSRSSVEESFDTLAHLAASDPVTADVTVLVGSPT